TWDLKSPWETSIARSMAFGIGARTGRSASTLPPAFARRTARSKTSRAWTEFCSVRFSRQRPGNPEAHHGVPVGGGVPLARRRSQYPGRIEPRATAIDAHAGIPRLRCAAVRRRTGVSFGITILRPLPDVAGHVIEAEGVRRFRSHRVGAPPGVALEPGIAVRVGLVVSPEEARCGPGARCVFPLRLARQAISGLVQLPVEPGNVCLRVLPVD